MLPKRVKQVRAGQCERLTIASSYWKGRSFGCWWSHWKTRWPKQIESRDEKQKVGKGNQHSGEGAGKSGELNTQPTISLSQKDRDLELMSKDLNHVKDKYLQESNVKLIDEDLLKKTKEMEDAQKQVKMMSRWTGNDVIKELKKREWMQVR